MHGTVFKELEPHLMCCLFCLVAAVKRKDAITQAPEVKATGKAALGDAPDAFVFSHVESNVTVSGAVADVQIVEVLDEVLPFHPKLAVVLKFTQRT
jgi:hypothetical protein